MFCFWLYYRITLAPFPFLENRSFCLSHKLQQQQQQNQMFPKKHVCSPGVVCQSIAILALPDST